MNQGKGMTENSQAKTQGGYYLLSLNTAHPSPQTSNQASCVELYSYTQWRLEMNSARQALI
jgi:hypothetical protein